MYNAMPNSNNKAGRKQIRLRMQGLPLSQADQQFEYDLLLHRIWLEAKEITGEMWHHGRIKWDGTAPQLQMPAEVGMDEQFYY
jgi:hypothetical protein